MTYVAWGSTAKKLRYDFKFWWLKALGRKAYYQGCEEYRANLIGCECGIAPNVAIICYYNKIATHTKMLESFPNDIN